MSTRHAVRGLAAAIALASFAPLATPARAWDGFPRPGWDEGQLVDVQVRVEGRVAPLYVSPQGDDRRYVQAFAGRNYSLVLRNKTPGRIGVLIAVDGINVVNGQRSDLRSNESMYVLGPWESATIDGWRTSLDDIQRFVFVDEARSYATRTGQANGDMGWIRVLAFREQCPPWQPWGVRAPYAPREERSEDAPRAQAQRAPEPMAAAPAPQGALGGEAKSHLDALESHGLMSPRDESGYPGTGWGRHQSDHVERVEFTAERQATDRLVVRYEYAGGLRALGIDIGRDRLRERDNGQLGFAKPPRG